MTALFATWDTITIKGEPCPGAVALDPAPVRRRSAIAGRYTASGSIAIPRSAAMRFLRSLRHVSMRDIREAHRKHRGKLRRKLVEALYTLRLPVVAFTLDGRQIITRAKVRFEVAEVQP